MLSFCCCFFQAGRVSFQSGIHEIGDVCEDSGEPFEVSKMYARCNVSTDGGGWTVILRRVAGGTVDFNREWEDYEDGFGDLSGEFWYGLKNMHCLTTREEMELRIDLRKANGEHITWVYKTFRVAGSADKYRLHIGEWEGLGGDGMAHSKNRQFSTRDEDNDANSGNCASSCLAGWWHNTCYGALLTGPHVTPAGASEWAKLYWIENRSTYVRTYYPNVEMMVRPKSCLTG